MDQETVSQAIVTVQTGSKLEAFFAAFSRKTRVERRSPHSRSEFSMGERKLLHCEAMIPPLEGACTVTTIPSTPVHPPALDIPESFDYSIQSIPAGGWSFESCLSARMGSGLAQWKPVNRVRMGT